MTGTTLDTIEDGWDYNGFGEADAYAALRGASVLFAFEFVRDNAGRITNKTETIDGMTSSYHYLYDADRGWLTEVFSNTVPWCITNTTIMATALIH